MQTEERVLLRGPGADSRSSTSDEDVILGEQPRGPTPRTCLVVGMTAVVLALYFAAQGSPLQIPASHSIADGVVSQQQRREPLPPPYNVHPGYGQCGPMEPGIDYWAEHGKNLPGVPDMQACCARCQATPSCIAWVWVTQTGLMSLPRSECHLKAGMFKWRVQDLGNGAKVAADLISGNASGRMPPQQKGQVDVHRFNYEATRSGGPALDPPACPANGAELPIINTQHSNGGVRFRVLTFNIEWWSNFNQGRPAEVYAFEKTETNPAIELLKRNLPFDVIGLQECNDINWLLLKAGMAGEYEGRQGPEEVCVAWRKSAWQNVGDGFGYVTEDRRDEYWRRRGVQWLRLQHIPSQRHLLFVNHHGPLPRDTGGACGGSGTAGNILSVIAQQAQLGDGVVALGDFNAAGNSQTVQALSQRLARKAFGTIWGGLDNIFSNLDLVATSNLGSGGSDHEAIAATFSL